ncbi:hypothetical protein FGRMN_6599 [Fusarium graminum]|nr:hypothetical protein FGRMN_6599 [Fusarium graminum]
MVSQKREVSDRGADAPPAKRRVVTSARREQNRLAQKAYRERQKDERQRLKQQKSQVNQGRLRPLLKRSAASEPERQDLTRKPSQKIAELLTDQISLENDGEESSGSNFPDLYRNMLQFSPTAFFASCLANAVSLGFDLSRIADCGAEYISPFYQPSLSTTLDRTALSRAGSAALSSFNNTSIPKHLRPTMAQVLIPHHVSLDLIPLPFLRERAIMLSAAMPHLFNNWELKVDVYERGGLTIWRLNSSKQGRGANARDSYPPWDMKSWEAAPWFLKKWSMLMGGDSEELFNQSIGWQVIRDIICSRDGGVQRS